MKNLIKRIALGFVCMSLSAAGVEAHEHLAAGVDSSGRLVLFDASNNPLSAINPTIYHMVWTPAGQNYGGYYSLGEIPRVEYPTDYFTFIALSDGTAQPDGPNHAPTGSDIWMEISSVSGPTDAHFGFWESNASYFSTTPTNSFLADGSALSFKFEISEPIGDGDPFGHIHNRGFTVDQPGDYYVNFTLYDLSGLGEDGGPLAGTSQTYTFHFVAVPEPGTFCLVGLGVGLFAIGRYRASRRARNLVS